MMRPLFDIALLKEDIEAGTLILTSNNRLATKIRHAWGLHQQQCGNTSWPEPEVHALEHWINENWLRCCDSGTHYIDLENTSDSAIASQQIEQILWEEAIGDDAEKPDNLLPTSFSILARNSFNIIQRWQIPLARLQNDSPMLCRWAQIFRNKLRQLRLITPADSVLTVLKNYENGTLPQHSSIVTLGFDSIPPLYLATISTASKNITHYPATGRAPIKQAKDKDAQAQRTQFYDEQQELIAVAKWAHNRQLNNPNHRIGIVVPELARMRNQIERILRQQFEPHHQHPNQPRSAPNFNISAGVPLSDTPMIATALLLLSLNRKQLPLDELCRLLNLPFWGNKKTLEQDLGQPLNQTKEQQDGYSLIIRSLAEKRLRKLALPKLSCAEFRYQLHLAEQSLEHTLTNQDPIPEPGTSSSILRLTLSSLLEQSETLRRNIPNKTSFQAWLLLFQQQLDIFGWPGNRSLDSIEYQQYQHWLRVLEQYSSLDQLHLTVTLPDALRQLQQLADQSIFQPEIDDAPIQVLGLLESSALCFDHLWIVGMDNHHWPPSIAPNPLLPISLQREYATPRSLPERELQLAQNQISGLKNSANEVIFSFSEFDTSRLRQVSTLIADLPEISFKELSTEKVSIENPNSEKLSSEAIDETTVLEKISCEYGPALDLTKETVKGGSSIFRDQATCPFNAFARHRLGAEQSPEPQLGLSSMDRGSLLHDCLERLWQQLGCQQQLLELTDIALNELVNANVDLALQRWKKRRPDLFGPEFTAIEKQRLTALLVEWLALEKTRPAFTVVAFEKQAQTSFAGLPLRLIIDRIDQLEDGRQIIIDYKTGKANTNSWLGDRPEQPQLPLYVLCSETPVAAATFAVVNVSQQQFVGFSESQNLLPGVYPLEAGKKSEPESWDDLLTLWQTSLTLLGQEFQQAYAAVKIYKPTAMQYQQELMPLNRLPELSMRTTMFTPVAGSVIKEASKP
ncbi:MAG: PD-(D/E)XK nuclease family protein [Porticoccus sp.]|nr:PD-(D/E)XK nuclease family protein [Porticoccus sp.]